MDSQIDLRALQVIGIAEGPRRILRVWYNDGRIRDWDCRAIVTRQVQGQEQACGRSDLLADLPEAAEDSPAYGKGCVCR